MSLTYLITGGSGSLGHALVPLLLGEYDARKVIVLSRSESKQAEMRQQFPDSRMRYFIGDVRDLDRLRRAFTAVDVVLHAGALKRVPEAEYSPDEWILTNVHGTMNVNAAALDSGVKRVMLISTDKSCAPATLYGATKLCAERNTIAANSYSGAFGTRFAAVRYGNVINSTGSVIPLFKAQAESGCVTITDRDATRFWMTLEQAARFVLRCTEDMQGGETYVPIIPAARVVDVAEAVAPGCRHEVIGLRAGEKLHEELITNVESRRTTLEAERQRYNIAPALSNDVAGLPHGFTYTSDNSRLLTVQEIRSLIGLEAMAA